jgi:hypothetical protein
MIFQNQDQAAFILILASTRRHGNASFTGGEMGAFIASKAWQQGWDTTFTQLAVAGGYEITMIQDTGLCDLHGAPALLIDSSIV